MNLADKTVIYIPHLYSADTTLIELVSNISRSCGGATHALVRGTWFNRDGDEQIEHMVQITWWHKNPEPSLINIIKIARFLIEEMGEECVMVEYTRAEVGTVARFLTVDDVQESSDE